MNIHSIKRALKCYVMVVCHATCFFETFQDGCVSPWPDPPGAQFGHTPPKWWYVSVWFTDTHWTSGAVRHQLGSGVTKVVLSGICSAALRHPVLALTPNKSRTLCASGCSRPDKRVLGEMRAADSERVLRGHSRCCVSVYFSVARRYLI